MGAEDAVLEGFPEEVTFELRSKGWVGGKSIPDREQYNSTCICPGVREAKGRSCRQSTEEESVCREGGVSLPGPGSGVGRAWSA